ncbi:hypothetical protein [Anaerotignum sp. MB30-C6]|uniref:hypothetical protein n=1 Tax=Anaerotignum sp. MB30-C6 TaxID=3070814 RepID=UPI0027DE51FA|nr:hypothetical protein [Anaerotignum sp. MB30-C6]WMI81542.1 hypothetical protein RBQ60_02065 [Anaerotignum sp. MB30-C6]
MQGPEEKKETPRKIEFVFQIGVIIFIVLGAVIKHASWLFWILGILCAVGWVMVVQKEKRKKEDNK